MSALVEHHRWYVGFEAIYRERFLKYGIDNVSLAVVLAVFGVARNLSSLGKLQLHERLPEISRIHAKQPSNWQFLFDAICDRDGRHNTSHLYIEGSSGRGGAPRSFISGITKILWFSGAHQMPMFDVHTCRAVHPSGRNASDRAVDFYRKLENDWSIGALLEDLSKAGPIREAHWKVCPERLLDKLLMRKSLNGRSDDVYGVMICDPARCEAYLSTLDRKTSAGLRGLVDPIHKVIQASKFGERLSA